MKFVEKLYANKVGVIIFSLLFVCFTSSYATENFTEKEREANKQQGEILANEIMQHVINRAEIYAGYIKEYDAQAYIKGTTHVLKKNFLFKFAPDFLALDKKKDNTILETLINIHYQAPNNFTQKIYAINGNSLNIEDIRKRAMQFLNINIYNPTSFNDEVLMPIAKNAFKYYNFHFVEEIDTMGVKILKIRITPKQKSQKLISGDIYILDKLWTIQKIDISGKWDFSTFYVDTEFGLTEEEFLLPVKTELILELKLLKNHIINHYSSSFSYSSIKKYEDKSKRAKKNYDLSDYFNVAIDSLPVVKDSLFWKEVRTFPLSEDERDIYASDENNRKKEEEQDSSFFKNTSWNFTKGIVSPKHFEYNSTNFSYSGLLNPFKLSISGFNNFTYWQQLKLNKRNPDTGRELSFKPDIGFVFKEKEVFFTTPLSWLYQPAKIGQLNFTLGNRNSSYNSEVFEQFGDSAVVLDSLNLNYYRHYYLELKSRYELFNGFLLDLGVDYHLYNPVKSNNEQAGEEIQDLINEKYKSFTPVIAYQWTYGQYYRFNNKRKEYLWSKYPTLSFEYARGIPNVFGSNSSYERIEADIQQKIPLGLLRSFQYYVGGGVFTNTKSVYFADFKKFAKRNFPQSWDDRIGGVFQLLDGDWYNASDSYFQAHVMYESPFMLLMIFKNVTKDIFKERFYFSQLYTPALPCYTELGYGIGNYLFNAGFFVSLNKGKYEEFGFKFAFEIGRK